MRRLFKRRKEITTILVEDTKLINRLEEEMQKEQQKIEEMTLSLVNAENMHNFINTIGLKPTHCHQRYLKIYQKELMYRGVVQVIYAVFYEDDYIYEMEYLDRKSEKFDVNTDVRRFKLKCMMFIDGKDLDPSLNECIDKESDSIKIEELNMYGHEGKGAGSFYLECLTKELMRYPRIHFLYGDLSTVDFAKKDKLIHFYRKNGFEIVIPMTEKKNGYVQKTIR